MSKIIEAALLLKKNNISCIPFKVEWDKTAKKYTKTPTIKDVETFQNRCPTNEEIEKNFKFANGIGLCTGRLIDSDSCIVVLDFDQKGICYSDFCEIEEVKELIEKYDLPTNQTISGGYHMFFRSKNDINNKKLAYDENKKIMIETRGMGGKVVIPPTQGYKRISKRLFCDIPVLENDEVDILMAAAQSFDKYIPEDTVKTKIEQIEYKSDGKRPGDLYNQSFEARADVVSILRERGWTQVKSSDLFWRRPGKSKGVSAILNKSNIFVNFSSNATDFDTKGYTPFFIYTYFRFDNDPSRAAKELYKRGFADPAFKNSKIFERCTREARKKLEKGVKKEDLFQVINELSETTGLAKDEVEKIFDTTYKENSDFFNFENKTQTQRLLLYLKKEYVTKFRYNIVTNQTEMKQGEAEWKDLDRDTVLLDIRNKFDKDFRTDTLNSFLDSKDSRYIEQYDPFKKYFGTLKAEDNGTFEKFCNCIELKDSSLNDYFKMMLLKHLIRAIRCATEDNYMNRHVFILGGAEEIGKTSLIRHLNPFKDYQYYSEEFLNLDNKDFLASLSKVFIYNIEEFNEMSETQMQKMKAVVSKLYSFLREAYRRDAAKQKKRCSFFASTNSTELFNSVEFTRFLVFEIKKINFAYSKININDFYANVLFFMTQIDEQLDSDEKELQKAINFEYLQIDLVDSYIQEYLECECEDVYNNFMSYSVVHRHLCEKIDKSIKIDTITFSKKLHKLGFKKDKVKGIRGIYCKFK